MSNHIMGAVLAFVLLLAGTAGTADAAKTRVAVDGTDGPGCGTKSTPCRTISRGIEETPEGGVVEVGPGRYGDVNANGILDDVEDEPVSSCDTCTLLITKRVTIISRLGAEATVIDAGGMPTTVRIEAPGVVFGRRKRGFTVTGSSVRGLISSGGKIRIEGNIATGNLSAGFDISGPGSPVIVGNLSYANEGSGFVIDTRDPALIVGNRAVANGLEAGNGGIGFFIKSSGTRLAKNIASGNDGPGFDLTRRAEATQNTATANRGDGFRIDGTGHRMHGNFLSGNGGPGLRLKRDSTAFVTKNTIIGNDAGRNCGILNLSENTIDAPKNYFGPAGPGANPADEICDERPGSVTLVSPVAPKAFRIRVKPAQ